MVQDIIIIFLWGETDIYGMAWIVDISINLFNAKSLYLFVDKSINL